MPLTSPPPPRRVSSRVAAGLAAALSLLLVPGCSADQFSRGYLPAESAGATNQTPVIQSLWNGSWIAAMLVGVVVWGLTLWVVVAYRRRKGEGGLPPQVRYNLPLEIMYTVIPLFMVAVLFYYTARDQTQIEAVSAEPQNRIEVVGKQWSWDFNYVDEDVYESGVQARVTDEDVTDELPTLFLPVDESVLFELRSRDVNHSFWVPAFLYKKDLIAGRLNTFEVTPTKEGVFQGKCAELCGEFHSAMLFNVAVVSREEYDAQMEALREAGQTGQLPADLGRSDTGDADDLEDTQIDESGGSNS